MRTTVSIPEPLLRDAKVIAARNGTSLSAVVVEGLRAVVEKKNLQLKDDRRPPLVIHKSGGVKPGIDLDKTSELMALMDGWDEADRRQRADLRRP